jgi:hypothetical protein
LFGPVSNYPPRECKVASKGNNGDQRRGQDPTLVLMGVVKYILRAASGLAEAQLDGSGSATKSGFSVSHNPEARAVFVEALGFGGSERQMLDRYKRVISRGIQTVLRTNVDAYVTVLAPGMVRISGLTDAQIETLRARYSG